MQELRRLYRNTPYFVMAGLDPAIAHQQSGRGAMRGSSLRMTESVNMQAFYDMKLPKILFLLNPGQQWAFAGMTEKGQSFGGLV
jgi:hypothetical protein